MVECWTCGRKKIAPGEGRIADGSWPADVRISEDAHGEWFCSFGCYDTEIDAERHRIAAALAARED